MARRGGARTTVGRRVLGARGVMLGGSVERVPDDVTGDGRGLRVTSHLVIPPDEITVRATTSGGPGGQHANVTRSAVVATT